MLFPRLLLSFITLKFNGHWYLSVLERLLMSFINYYLNLTPCKILKIIKYNPNDSRKLTWISAGITIFTVLLMKGSHSTSPPPSPWPGLNWRKSCWLFHPGWCCPVSEAHQLGPMGTRALTTVHAKLPWQEGRKLIFVEQEISVSPRAQTLVSNTVL